MNEAAGDYRQKAGAVTIDAGHYDPMNGAFDVDGDLRNIGSPDIGADEFVAAPTASTGPAGAVTDGAAALTGSVNAKGSPTSYHFEYGTTTAYGATTSPSDAGSGVNAVAASASLSGLTPGTTYHYRVVASNAAGVAQGGDQTFTTAPATPAAPTSPASPAGSFAGVKLVSTKLRLRGRFITVKLSCPAGASGRCTGTTKLSAKRRRTSSRAAATVALGRASFSIAAGQRATVKVVSRARAGGSSPTPAVPPAEPRTRRTAAQGDPGSALHAVAESVGELTVAYDAELERVGEAAPFPGEWDWVRVPEGVLVKVVECEDFEAMLPAVADGLARRGVEGTLDLHEWPEVAEPPYMTHLLECRLRVRGERRHRESHFFDWRPDREALGAIAAGAARWCARHGERSTFTLRADVAPRVPLEPGVDLVARMREAVADHTHFTLYAMTPESFRIASVEGWQGAVSFVEGGAAMEDGRWRGALADLTEALRDHADLAVYGFIKRGSEVPPARLGDSLTHDWPERPDVPLLKAEVWGAPFQDEYAPDAFGVQLLGPGYAGRIPEGPTWRQERVGKGSVLLEHIDLPAWFDAPFLPHDYAERLRGLPPPPPVLVEARTEFAPILFTEEVPWEASEGRGPR